MRRARPPQPHTVPQCMMDAMPVPLPKDPSGTGASISHGEGNRGVGRALSPLNLPSPHSSPAKVPVDGWLPVGLGKVGGRARAPPSPQPLDDMRWLRGEGGGARAPTHPLTSFQGPVGNQL